MRRDIIISVYKPNFVVTFIEKFELTDLAIIMITDWNKIKYFGVKVTA